MRSVSAVLENVSFSYDGDIVLQDVNLTIPPDDFLVLFGPNGGGKTTLIKLMLGLLSPKQGRIEMLGTTPCNAAAKIGYVPQNILAGKHFPISVLEVALMGRLGHTPILQRYTSEDMEITMKSLEMVGMAEFSKRSIDSLSGGQRQRVYIARALASEPEMILLDEPTTGIDIRGQQSIYELLKKMNESIAVVVVSHNLFVLMGYAKTVAHVEKTVYSHEAPQFTEEFVEKLYASSKEHACPLDFLTHLFLKM